jgi:hypothetical protein
MSTREWVVWRTLKNEHGQCSWCVTRDGTLYVRTHLGSKCTQLGWHPPDLLARILTREINSENAPGHTD